jgi:hypothetical protein
VQPDTIDPYVTERIHVELPLGARSGPSLRLGVCWSHMPERHLKAAQTHDDAALRHEKAALHWDECGDSEHAELERRNVVIERAAAQLERDRAVFKQRTGAESAP